MSGILQFEGMLMDHQVHMAQRNALEWQAYAQQLERDLNEMSVANAANLGVRCALSEQLRRVDPRNPLLNDEAMRERLLQEAGDAFLSERDFDAARRVGGAFKVEGRPTKLNQAGEALLLAVRLQNLSPGHFMLKIFEEGDWALLLREALRSEEAAGPAG